VGAFGEVRAKSGTLSTSFLFTGEQFDAKARLWEGLYYLRARYYDSETGRFLTQDPFGGFVISPQSLNRYPYAVNDPVNLVDPWGLCGFRSFGDFGDCFRDAAQWLGEDYHWATVGAAAGGIAFAAGVVILASPAALTLTGGLAAASLMSAGLGVGTYLTVISVAHSGKECAAGDTGACVSAGIGGVSAPLGFLPAPEGPAFVLLPVAVDVAIWALNPKD